MPDITLPQARSVLDAALKRAAETGAIGVSGSTVENDHAVAAASAHAHLPPGAAADPGPAYPSRAGRRRLAALAVMCLMVSAVACPGPAHVAGPGHGHLPGTAALWVPAAVPMRGTLPRTSHDRLPGRDRPRVPGGAAIVAINELGPVGGRLYVFTLPPQG